MKKNTIISVRLDYKFVIEHRTAVHIPFVLTVRVQRSEDSYPSRDDFHLEVNEKNIWLITEGHYKAGISDSLLKEYIEYIKEYGTAIKKTAREYKKAFKLTSDGNITLYEEVEDEAN